MNTSSDEAAGDTTDTVTIRIVFDGAPLAGKTTAAYALGEAIGGETVTPFEHAGRTAWFDWMTFTGGRHNGKPIRVELVTVPGQTGFNDRRKYLLGWGDVVVFVADTHSLAFSASVEKFRQLRAELGADPAVQVIVIANKRDLQDVVALSEVRAELGLDDSTVLVEGVATSGDGIRQAFIHAVRSVIGRDGVHDGRTTPEELLAEMKDALGGGDAAQTRPGATLMSQPASDQPASDFTASQPGTDPAPAVALATQQANPLGAGHAEGVVPSVERTLRTAANDKAFRLVEHGLLPGKAVAISELHWKAIVSIAASGEPGDEVPPDRRATILDDLLGWGIVAADAEEAIDHAPAPQQDHTPDAEEAVEHAPAPQPDHTPDADEAIDHAPAPQPDADSKPKSQADEVRTAAPITATNGPGLAPPHKQTTRIAPEATSQTKSVTSPINAVSTAAATPTAAAVDELRQRVGVDGTATPPARDTEGVRERNDRYRALRELRRSLASN